MRSPHGNPRRLVRLLEQVATGNRRVRGLAAALDVEAGEVQDTLLTGAFLGLLRLDPEPHLSRDGLAYVHAGARRSRVLLDIVRAHPQLGPLYGQVLDRDAWVATVRAVWPELPEGAAARHALAVRRFVEPVWRRRLPPASPEQLALPLSADVHRERATIDMRAGADDSPDVYALLLRALLDHGELLPSRLRAVFDAGGAEPCGIGGYVAMAVRRGDARREGDTLVVTGGAVARRQLAESATAIALSDADFRLHLQARLDGRPGDDRRFGPWMRRFFGEAGIAEGLQRLLFGRSLASLPVAGATGEAPGPPAGPFLTRVGEAGLFLAVPSALCTLASGLSGVNRALRAGAASALTVCRPSVVDPRVRVHGGLLSPGETPPRVVADLVSLRLRAVRAAPGVALLTAAAAAGRRGPTRLRVSASELGIDGKGVHARPFGEVVERMLVQRRWIGVWGPGGPAWADLAEALVELGILDRTQGMLVLDEAFFLRLQTEPEHRVVWEELQPLVDLVEAFASPRAGR